MRRVYVAIAALWMWAFVLLLTHAGARSPYAYGWAMFGGPAKRLLGTVVNPDATGMVPVAMYFYDAQPPLIWGYSPNFRLPLHGFVVSVFMALTRSYLLANYLANLGALMLLSAVAVKLCVRYELPLLPSTIALMTMFSLPWLVTYVGQPMHYIVGTTINFLVVIAAFSMEDDVPRRPWAAGLLVAVVVLNYDPYIYALTLAIWFLFFVRFRRWFDYPVFFAVAVLPIVGWTEFVRWASHDTLSRLTEHQFMKPITAGWMEFLHQPVKNVLQPYLATHIGLHIGAHFLLAEVHWPLLITCGVALWWLRKDIPRGRRTALILLLAVVFAVHQFGTAPFDWESNPRRALPVVLAVGFAYCWCAARLWPRRTWRVVFVAVLAICAFLSMADTLLQKPAITYLSTGQAIQRPPKDAMLFFSGMRFDAMPALMKDEGVQWRDVGQVPLNRDNAPRFFGIQTFLLFFCCVVLWALARSRLLPRYAPIAGVVVWLASFVRFV